MFPEIYVYLYSEYLPVWFCIVQAIDDFVDRIINYVDQYAAKALDLVSALQTEPYKLSHTLSTGGFNSIPNDKNRDWSALKPFADDTFNIAKIMIFVCDRVENIVGKGENAGYQHFLLFLQCFQKASFHVSSKPVIVWSKVNTFS